MEFLNVFKGLKKSNSETKLGDRLSFGRKSKTFTGAKSIQNSPLPPRPTKGNKGVTSKNSVGRIIENITDDNNPNIPSLHSPRRDTDQFGNVCVPLVIKGIVSYHRYLIISNVNMRLMLVINQISILSITFLDDESGSCPSCHQPYNTGKRRMLVDSCGHERCFQCTFTQETCSQCQAAVSVQSPAMSVRSMSGARSMSSSGIQTPIYGSAASPGNIRRPQVRPSPGPGARRHNWIHRHNRRPTTVNIDDNTMSGIT